VLDKSGELLHVGKVEQREVPYPGACESLRHAPLDLLPEEIVLEHVRSDEDGPDSLNRVEVDVRRRPVPREEVIDPPPELIELLPKEPGQVPRRLLGVALHERRERKSAGVDQDEVGSAVHTDVRAPLPVPGAVRPVAGDTSRPGQPRLRMHLLGVWRA
jgi:hypothetical protein